MRVKKQILYCRVVLDTAVIYDLKQRSFRKIAKLPDAIQSPAVCVHNNVVYAAGHKNIYRYEDSGTSDRWTTVISINTRTDCMISYKGYIYCTQNYFNHLNRFRPDEDSSVQLITQFYYPPATVCDLGKQKLHHNILYILLGTIITQSILFAW